MIKRRQQIQPISKSSTPININKSNEEDEEDEEYEEFNAELEREYHDLEDLESEDSNDQRDLNEQSEEFKEEYSENDSINCPKLINFYSDYYQENSKVILLIAEREVYAKDAQDAKDFKDAQYVQYANVKKIEKKPKSESDDYSYDYNDTPSKKSKENEKYDELTTYKYVVLIISYINLKYDCITILYTRLFGIFQIFHKNINLKDFKDNMKRLIIDIEKPDNEKLFYYDIKIINYLIKNINDKEIIKNNLNSNKNINTISIKKKIILLNIEIGSFLDWNYHMADNINLPVSQLSQRIQSVSKEFENNTKKYYKFNDKIIKKFSEDKKISPNESITCLPFCKKNEFEKNYLTYKTIFQNYILNDIMLFNKILNEVYLLIDKLNQIYVNHIELIENGKIVFLKDYQDFKNDVKPHIHTKIYEYNDLIKIFGFDVNKNTPVLISPNYDKDLNKKKTKCSKIITPLQVGSSCWFMATIVAMFYSQLSKKLLLKQIKNIKTINKIRIDKNGNQLYDIFYNILNDKGTSNDYNSDINENTYWKIMKLLHEKNKEIFPYKPVVNEGYNSDFYIGRLYNLLNIDYTIIEYNTNTKNKYMVYSLLNEEYNDYYTIFFGNTMKKEISRIQIVKKKVNDFISNLRGTTLFTKSPDILIVMIKDSEYDNIYGLNKYSKKMKKIKDDNYEQIKTMNDNITYNGNEYNLDSVILANHYLDTSDDPIHNVAGITCKRNKYIYNGWPRSNMTQDNQQRHQLACELIESNWKIKGDADFCLNNSTNCMDKINDVKNYEREYILNLRKRYKETKNLESHKKFIEDIKNKLCFNFSKGYRTLIYVKKGATSSASAESLSPAARSPAKPAAARSPAKAPAPAASILKKGPAKPAAVPARSPAAPAPAASILKKGPAKPAQGPGPANVKYTFTYKFAQKPPNSRYTPIYNSYDEPYLKNNKQEANFMASLNAGDSGLYVGGGYINAEFNKAIVAKDEVDADLTNLSKYLHEMCSQECYKEIKLNNSNSEGYFYKFNSLKYFSKEKYFDEMYLYISEKKLKIPGRKGIGNIYIDILKNNPYNNPANKAMIYCYGPEGKSMNETNMKVINMDYTLKGDEMVEKIFLDYVYITGKNIAKAIFEYNQYKITEKNRIDYVRICLI